jgi:tetratricopeptide (TPR) repeat protein
MLFEWNWTCAEQEASHAVRLDPNSVWARILQYYLLTSRAELDNALECIRHARKLDPLSLMVNSLVAIALFTMRRYDEARGEVQNVLELNPRYVMPHHILGLVLEQEGRYAEAIVEFDKAVGDFGDRLVTLGALGRVYALSGQLMRAHQVLRQLESGDGETQVGIDPVVLAMIYTGLGETDLAFAKLNEAHDYHSTHFVWLKAAPYWDTLRPDPRFGDFIRRLGLA